MQSFLPNMFYYGFPVVLLSTVDANGKADVTPITCTFNIGTNAVIVLVKLNQAYDNVMSKSSVVDFSDSPNILRTYSLCQLT